MSVSSEEGWEGVGGGHWCWRGESQVFWFSFGRGWQSVFLQNQGKESREYVE